jgi:hypothetical protein
VVAKGQISAAGPGWDSEDVVAAVAVDAEEAAVLVAVDAAAVVVVVVAVVAVVAVDAEEAAVLVADGDEQVVAAPAVVAVVVMEAVEEAAVVVALIAGVEDANAIAGNAGAAEVQEVVDGAVDAKVLDGRGQAERQRQDRCDVLLVEVDVVVTIEERAGRKVSLHEDPS